MTGAICIDDVMLLILRNMNKNAVVQFFLEKFVMSQKYITFAVEK